MTDDEQDRRSAHYAAMRTAKAILAADENGDAAIRSAKLILIADGFCELMAANDFDLSSLPVTSLEKLRNMCSTIESQARREMARRCLEVLDLLNHGWGD